MKSTRSVRRVAIVTYFFPPLGGVGVQRVLKYVTYLPKSRWRPVVFTPRNPAYPLLDPRLTRAVTDDLEVHRSFILEPSLAYRRVAAIFHRSNEPGSVRTQDSARNAPRSDRFHSAVRVTVA